MKVSIALVFSAFLGLVKCTESELKDIGVTEEPFRAIELETAIETAAESDIHLLARIDDFVTETRSVASSCVSKMAKSVAFFSDSKAEKTASVALPWTSYQESLTHYAQLGIPPSVLFTGTQHWQAILKVYKSPLIFLNNFELSFNHLFRGVNPRIKFGIRFMDSELLEFRRMSSQHLVEYVIDLKRSFETVTGQPLKYCIFTKFSQSIVLSDLKREHYDLYDKLLDAKSLFKSSNISLKMKQILASQGVTCIDAQPWNGNSSLFSYVNTNEIGNLKKALKKAKRHKIKTRGLKSKKVVDDHESVVSQFSDESLDSNDSSSSSQSESEHHSDLEN